MLYSISNTNHSPNFTPRARKYGLQSAQPKLGTILVRDFGLAEKDLFRALILQRHRRASLGKILISLGLLTEQDLLSALSTQHNCSQIDPAKFPPAHRVLQHHPPEFWIKHRAFAVEGTDATLIICANPDSYQDIATTLPKDVRPAPAIATEAEITTQIGSYFGSILSNRAETLVPSRYSCRGWRGRMFQAFVGIAFVLLISALILFPTAAIWTLTITALCAMIPITILRLIALRARPPKRHDDPTAELGPLPTVSILVPLYKEQEITAKLLKRLGNLTYPKEVLEVCLVLEADDETTINAVARATLPHWIRAIHVPVGTLRTKPRAMNYALPFLNGSIIGIYDAEDAPEPDQLMRVIRHFSSTKMDVACVQGVLDYYNSRRNWLARCFTIEYATWFRVLLPGLDRLGLVVPLGGTTLFFRRDILEELGGWDAHNVTEDADLGVRLARAGYRTECVSITTYEEANCRPWPWVKQRSRWIKGFVMTYATHMRRPTDLIRDIGWWRFAGLQILLLGTVLQFSLAPVLWSYWILVLGLSHPVGTGLGVFVTTIFVGAALITLGVNFRAVSEPERHHLRLWVPMMAIYNPLGTLAAYKALWELLFKPFYWDKTSHGHLTD